MGVNQERWSVGVLKKYQECIRPLSTKHSQCWFFERGRCLCKKQVFTDDFSARICSWYDIPGIKVIEHKYFQIEEENYEQDERNGIKLSDSKI